MLSALGEKISAQAFQGLTHYKLDKLGDTIYHPKPDQESDNPLSRGAWCRTHLREVCRPCHDGRCFDCGSGFPCTALVSDGDHLPLLSSDGAEHSAHPEFWLEAGLLQLTAAQHLHGMKLVEEKTLQTGLCPLEV